MKLTKDVMAATTNTATAVSTHQLQRLHWGQQHPLLRSGDAAPVYVAVDKSAFLKVIQPAIDHNESTTPNVSNSTTSNIIMRTNHNAPPPNHLYYYYRRPNNDELMGEWVRRDKACFTLGLSIAYFSKVCLCIRNCMSRWIGNHMSITIIPII